MSRTAIDTALVVIAIVMFVSLIVVAAIMARRNLRTNRADRRGAARLVIGNGAIGGVAWWIAAHHTGTVLNDFDGFMKAAGELTLLGALLWTMYIALEPYARRLWPDGMLGWSRLLAGHFLDSRFGRDLLIGLCAGVVTALFEIAKVTLLPLAGASPPWLTYGRATQMLSSQSSSLAFPIFEALDQLQTALICAMVVVLLRLTLGTRWRWLSMLLVVCLLTVLSTQSVAGTNVVLAMVFPILAGATLAFVLFRFGLLPFAIALFARAIAHDTPFTPEWSHWAAFPGQVTLVVLIALAGLGFYAARAGQPLFGAIVRDDV